MADNTGASFSRLAGGDPRARRTAARQAEEWGSVKMGLITAVNSDHLLMQPFNENDILRVDRFPFGPTVPTLPPYYAGDTIVCMKLETPRVTDYPWIDLNLKGRLPVPFYVKPWNLNIPMITKSISARSCSISLPLSDTFTDTNGTLLSAHYMDAGCGWSALNGGLTSADWTIQSNKLQCENTAAAVRQIRCVTDDTTHDVQVSYTMGNAGTTVTARVLNRVIDSNNHWRGNSTLDVGTPANSLIAIQETNAGVLTTRASSTVTMATGDNCTLLLEDGNPGADDLLLTLSGDRSASCTYNSTLHNTAVNVGLGYGYSGTGSTKTLLDSFSCAN